MRIIFSQSGEVFTETYGKSTEINSPTQKWITFMMNSKYLFTTIFIVASLILISVLLATNSTSETFFSKDNSISKSKVESRIFDDTQEKPAILVSSTATPTTISAPGTDGRSLQDKHCSQCHIFQWIEQTQKSRSEWESTLIQMEKMGVSLSEQEKAILLDYLVDPNQP